MKNELEIQVENEDLRTLYVKWMAAQEALLRAMGRK